MNITEEDELTGSESAIHESNKGLLTMALMFVESGQSVVESFESWNPPNAPDLEVVVLTLRDIEKN